MSVLNNFTSFLTANSRADTPTPTASPEHAVDERIVEAVRRAVLMPLPSLPDAVGLTPDQTAAAVERLRLLRVVELVARPESPDTRFLRVAPAAYGRVAL